MLLVVVIVTMWLLVEHDAATESPQIDRTIGHYRITSKLGAGGMGEVFLAEDTRLERKAAIKFLPAKLAADPERRERFLREARAASANSISRIRKSSPRTIRASSGHEVRATAMMIDTTDG